MSESQIKSLVFDVALSAAIKAIIAAYPFLNIPVLKQIFTFLINKIAEALYEEISKYVIFSLIDMKTNEQKQAYDAAVTELKSAQTLEEIEVAKQKFKNTLHDLIVINPV